MFFGFPWKSQDYDKDLIPDTDIVIIWKKYYFSWSREIYKIHTLIIQITVNAFTRKPNQISPELKYLRYPAGGTETSLYCRLHIVAGLQSAGPSLI